MACTLAESPSDPLHRKLRQLRCLRCRFDCNRVERTSSRAGVAPAEVQRLSRRTITPNTSFLKAHKNVVLQQRDFQSTGPEQSKPHAHFFHSAPGITLKVRRSPLNVLTVSNLPTSA